MHNGCQHCWDGRAQALSMSLGFECPDHGEQEVSLPAELKERENAGRTAELMACLIAMCPEHCAKGEPVNLRSFSRQYSHVITWTDTNVHGDPVRPETTWEACPGSPIWQRPDLNDSIRGVLTKNLKRFAELVAQIRAEMPDNG